MVSSLAGLQGVPGLAAYSATKAYLPGATSPERVAVTALDALGHGCRVVPGPLNRVSALVLRRLLPRRTAITVFGQTAAALKD